MLYNFTIAKKCFNMTIEKPRAFYYKIYKILCRLFGCDAICYGKISKKDQLPCIYAYMLNGFKNPIICAKYIDDSIFKGVSFIQLSKKCSNKPDIQKEIVKAIM